MNLLCLIRYQLAATIFIMVTLSTKVTSLYFSFPSFKPNDEAHLLLNENSKIYLDSIQVTPDIRGPISNYSGRVFYKEQLKLWDSQRGMKASFNSSFSFNVVPQTTPGGEGFAFILADDTSLQLNSGGQWLGIVNSSSIGVTNIVAVEFDTRKSYPEDVDDNHVGVDVKSINSIKQQSLGPHGVNISSGTHLAASIHFDAKEGRMTIFVSTSTDLNLRKPVLMVELDLSTLLPEDIFVGFSASTGEYTQLNAIRSWNFSSSEEHIEKNPKNLTWLWIFITLIVVGGACGLTSVCYWRKKHRKGQGVEEDLKIELEIITSSNAPHKFQLKELVSATRNFQLSNKLGQGGFGMVLIGEAAPPFVPLEKPAFTWPATFPVLNEGLNFQVTVSQNEPITELNSGR
ncbi:hypothetical protein VNO78_21237 [Psophocarpus tetragonolobus]|uniref:Legume lectin domain-containing protein n=1 Tax=Psophocarpus tetragonolobus TaxID=3891 RepID=A0AAN9SCE7_PSOTE